ncbi:hypothetical protein FA95DRAFT_1352824 [Auriscalpium vulgare]|uniref:Uncharacterized protein n=1 Tax=Auriscalpium vulgare TaxID=40419 RepID=A0ACB8RRP8_9AGAM|nr:hypothetical protein FA95DRAFT_1352824 [Auriscalpium vulgare]
MYSCVHIPCNTIAKERRREHVVLQVVLTIVLSCCGCTSLSTCGTCHLRRQSGRRSRAGSQTRVIATCPVWRRASATTGNTFTAEKVISSTRKLISRSKRSYNREQVQTHHPVRRMIHSLSLFAPKHTSRAVRQGITTGKQEGSLSLAVWETREC